MSYATLIIGESGSGKTTSCRNFDESEVLMIQVMQKPLPFKSNWKTVSKETVGNIIVSDNPETIMLIMERKNK